MTWHKTVLVALLLVPGSVVATAAPPKESPETPAVSAPATPAPAKPAPAPVVLEGKTLFQIGEPALGVSPEERAREISRRLGELVKDRSIRPDSVKVVEDEMVSLVVAEGMALLRVFDRDAAGGGATRQALAARYAVTIRAAIEEYNKEFSFRTLLLSSIHAVVQDAMQ